MQETEKYCSLLINPLSKFLFDKIEEFFMRFSLIHSFIRIAMAATEVFLYLVLAAATLIYLFFKKKFSYFKELEIPHIKPTFPMGNFGGLGTKFHIFDLVLNTYEEIKGKDVICGIYSFVEPIFVVIDPELAKTIMVKDFNNFVNRGQFVNEEEPLTGELKFKLYSLDCGFC